MQDILLSIKQYQALIHRLDDINQDVTSMKIKSETEAKYINNNELMMLLQVSKRTALRWRNSGHLPFVKIEKKLFYRTDIILNSFKLNPGSLIEADQSPPGDPIPEEEISQMGCERCPLFVILNS